MSTTPHLQHIWKLNPVCYVCELLFSKIPSQHFFLINKKQTILCKIKHRPGELSRSENITVTISGFAGEKLFPSPTALSLVHQHPVPQLKSNSSASFVEEADGATATCEGAQYVCVTRKYPQLIITELLTLVN